MNIGLDANIICYALDDADPEHEAAKKLLSDLTFENKIALNPTTIHEAYHTLVRSQNIHSDAELEAKAYMEKMGYIVQEKPKQKIAPKTGPHCQAINPFTNTNCDCCAMPLALEEYKAEIEKRKKLGCTISESQQNLQWKNNFSSKISTGQLHKYSKTPNRTRS